MDTVQTQVVTGTVVAKDGLTVALGGLITEGVADSRAEVPVIGKLPVIGFFFRRQVTIRSRTELVVLIRPYVFNTPSESAALERRPGARQQPAPQGRQSGRLAQYVQLAGNLAAQSAAKRVANDLSIPQRRPIDLLTNTGEIARGHFSTEQHSPCAARAEAVAIAAACFALAISAGCNNSFKLFNLGEKVEASKDPQPNMQPGQMQVLAEGGLSLEAQKDKQRASSRIAYNPRNLLRQQRLTTARRLGRAPSGFEPRDSANGRGRAGQEFGGPRRGPSPGPAMRRRRRQGPGWEALIADRTARPERYTAYDQARGQLFEAFKLGESQKAVDLPLVKLAAADGESHAGNRRVDAHRARRCCLPSGRPKPRRRFEQALQLGRQTTLTRPPMRCCCWAMRSVWQAILLPDSRAGKTPRCWPPAR